MDHQYNLLAVDDEPDNLEVVRAVLRDQPYAIFEASDGQQAWELLTKPDAKFDCMVLDRMMPRMDGMELTRLMKGDSRFGNLPIVMQTAAAEPDQVAEGLSLGVFCYLTKPCDPKILRAAISAALSQRQQWRELASELSQHRNFSLMLSTAQFELKSHRQARSLAGGLGAMAHNSAAVSLGLSELLSNAIEHGNLELSYRDKSRLLQTEGWWEEVQRRHQQPQWGERCVRVTLERKADLVVVRIEDEGGGFDWHPYINVDPDRAFDLHGRGIALSRQLAFLSMEYHGKGNVVTVSYEIAK